MPAQQLARIALPEVHCPCCGEPPATVFRARDEIAAELAMGEAFFASRLDRPRSRAELRDLTTGLHDMPADLLRCGACGVLIRDDAPGEDAFRDDRYEAGLLRSLHAVHAAAFREKESDYRALLRGGARVVEVGCYVGGFLTAAGEWGWDGIGVDVGGDTSRFCRDLGFDVRSRPLEECGFGRASFDAVFVWNCFEQLGAPRVTLAAAHRILRPSGVLVLRVPDAGFYAGCRSVVPLAYNCLLGWPYRFGFTAAALRRLCGEHGFALQCVLHAQVIRPLRHALRPWAREEEAAMVAARALGWIELTFRRE